MSHIIKETIPYDENTVIIDLLESGGSEAMNVDGSSTPVVFSAAPAAGYYWEIARVMIYIEDATAFVSTGFGALAALTNGVSVKINGSEIVNWKDNIEIVLSMYDAEGMEVFTKVDKSLKGRMSFTKMNSESEGVKVNTGDGFSFTVADDLQGLTVFRASVQGKQFPV